MISRTGAARKPTIWFVIWILVAMSFVLLCTPMTARAAENPLRIAVEQVLESSSDVTGNSFAYRLKPLGTNNPMPEGSAAEGYTFYATGNTTAETGPLAFSQQGIFRYELFQVIGKETPGWTYDRRTYVVEVHVDERRTTRLVAYNEVGAKVDKLRFTNKFESIDEEEQSEEEVRLPAPTSAPVPGPATDPLPTDLLGNRGSPGDVIMDSPDTPKTGDENDLWLWIVLIIFSLFSLTAIHTKKPCSR